MARSKLFGQLPLEARDSRLVPEGIVVQQVLVNTIGYIPADDLPNTKMERAVNLAIPFEMRSEPGSTYKNKFQHGFK